MGDDSPDEQPSWWKQNEQLRAELDLPTYDAPVFTDETYVHEVVSALEEEYRCDIQFADPTPGADNDWEIRVNGRPVRTVRRWRDSEANTVFEMTSQEFRETITEVFDD
ncbi:hypothetical protein [Natronorubrum sp. FCH18a]|uniref:hypothetical protein n=1 Tax=Natronorubrum sp. FCH18a TaxID=3447018 RepID=UPI003F51704A